APAPWNESASTLPEGAPTPPWNEPVPAPSEQASAEPVPEALSSEPAYEDAGAVETPVEGPPLALAEEPSEEPSAQEQPMAEGEAAAEPAMEGMAAEEGDPDEAHFHETFDRFLELRRETGEPGNVSYDKFVAKLRRNREELMARHNAKGVRFSVYLK